MTVILLVLNILCGLYHLNAVPKTADDGRVNRFIAALNWFAVGFLAMILLQK